MYVAMWRYMQMSLCVCLTPATKAEADDSYDTTNITGKWLSLVFFSPPLCIKDI